MKTGKLKKILDDWKTAIIHPLHKKKKQTDPSSLNKLKVIFINFIKHKFLNGIILLLVVLSRFYIYNYSTFYPYSYVNIQRT